MKGTDALTLLEDSKSKGLDFDTFEELLLEKLAKEGEECQSQK